MKSRRQKILDAFVYDKSIDRETYEREASRLEQDLEAARSSLRPEPDLDEVSAVIDRARSLLLDLSGTWNRLNPEERPALLSALFPEGLVLDAGRIGTA